jgi:hypothetical protein
MDELTNLRAENESLRQENRELLALISTMLTNQAKLVCEAPELPGKH